MQEPDRNPITRREVLGAAVASGLVLSCNSTRSNAAPLASAASASTPRAPSKGRALLVGSANALAGMKLHYAALLAGADPLDAAIEAETFLFASKSSYCRNCGKRRRLFTQQ